MSSIKCNESGGFYSVGKGFSQEKWESIMSLIDTKVSNRKTLTTRSLAEEAKISVGQAHKAMKLHRDGLRCPIQREKEKKAVGSRIGLGELLG